MKKIGILSDTHSYWDNKYEEYFRDCDEIWHAGDIGDISIVDRLKSIANVRAVSGNIDYGEVKRICPEYQMFEIEGVKVFMIHVGGYPGKYGKGIKSILGDNDIKLFVSGHSHILKVMYDQSISLLHINPGAAGRHGWQKCRTLIRVIIDEGNIRDLEVIELADNKSIED